MSGTYDQMVGILTSIGEERTYLSDNTVAPIIQYFKSGRADSAFAAGAALEGKQMWGVKHVNVARDGYSDFSGAKLASIDLGDSDWDAFQEGVRKLATSREKKSAFSNFVNWLDRHGPFDIIVDGANVAMHGQNFAGACFRFEQIDRLLRMLEAEFPSRRVLVILHIGRLHWGPAKEGRNQAFINKLSRSNQLYSVPTGSDDDWYWLYATVKARGNGLVISNDMCRDHIFQLLQPKYFLKWKERHMVRFKFRMEGGVGLTARIELPLPYTPCTQQLFNGTWMIPCEAGNWLCAKPL